MSTSQLFIPTKLKVGFRHREDTYLKTLSYIIYYDSKGVLRKGTSWENWRDKSIEPIEVDNVPHSGFILNKDVQRHGWSYYSSGRSMIRVYDDRGMEFEITPTNLLFILMNTNCHKRELEGKFVYAWDNKELVLLPVGCEEYKTSLGFTQLQGSKLTKEDMVPGCVYKSKKDEELTYLGRFSWFDYSYRKKDGFFSEKRYIFLKDKARKEYGDRCLGDDPLFACNDLDKIAIRLTETPVENFAEKLEELSKSKYCSKPIRLVTEELSEEAIENTWTLVGIEKDGGDGGIEVYEIRRERLWNASIRDYRNAAYYICYTGNLMIKGGKLIKTSSNDGYYYGVDRSYRGRGCTPREVIDTFVGVKIVLENGLEVNYNDY